VNGHYEMGTVLKEAIVVYFKVLSQHCLKCMRNVTKIAVTIAGRLV
jgi:hypothetical protein